MQYRFRKTLPLLLLTLLSAGNLSAQKARYAAVKQHLGKPALFVNDQPVTPMFYALTHVYGGRWSWEEVAQRNLGNFAQTGIRLYQLDLYLNDIWFNETDPLDMSRAQRQVRGVLEVCPDACVVLRVHVNAPFWWNEKYLEECTEYANGPIQRELKAGPPFHNEQNDTKRPLRASLASMKWREAAAARLREFCRRLARTPEGKAVVGMHLSGGIYGEWHYWGFIENDPDTGPAMTSWFRQWLRNKYHNNEALQAAWGSAKWTLDNAGVPGMDERLQTEDGCFKDPSKERRLIDYFTAQQQVVADDAEYFCRIAKENWPRPLLTGIFYGYLHLTFNRQTVGGHLFIEQILDSKYIDYLAAPQTYWEPTRAVGGSGNSRGIIESALLHGKLWLDEVDNGYLHQPNDYEILRYHERFDSSFLPVMTRSAILPLMRGIGFWYYDFGIQKGFGWWDNPRYLEMSKRIKNLFDSRVGVPYHSEADVLYVWSMDNFYYLKPAWSPVSMNVIDQSIEEAMRSGTAGDQVFDFDLKRVNLDQYKAVIFINCYVLSAEQKAFIREKVAKGGRTLIWNYMPGFTDGQKLDEKMVSELTGFRLKRGDNTHTQRVKVRQPAVSYVFEGPVDPMLAIDDASATVLATVDSTGEVCMASKRFLDYTSVYSSLPVNNTDVFRELFRAAGCHVYNTENDFTYANSGLLLLHSKTGGARNISLRNGKKLAIEVPPLSTTLLDAESGEVVFKDY